MYQWEMWGIQAVIVAVVLGGIWSLFLGPKSPFIAHWNRQIRDLEVKIKLDQDEDLIDDLLAVARLYIRVGKRWEADQALKRALIISKQQWGESSEMVLQILKESARLMDSMQRKGEAITFRNEIKRIKKGGKPKKQTRR